ncbi:MAG: Fe-S protein assembly co-chaperone HscB [Saprospiraceae bacterium]|nr:Fe-S protein assembly co-chaperone HscB [Saprospiraceae bacterium]
MNHFEFYKIPVALSVNEAAVRQVYLQNCKRYHPDFHTLSEESEQAQMLELSTRNNEAFKTLSDPDKRLRYVLEMKGLIGQDNVNPILPQDFLMEMMEINEALMELEFDFDAGRYNRAFQTMKSLENELDTSVQSILGSWTEATGSQADLEKVRDYFFKKRYLLRIKENLSKFAPH